MRKKGMAGTIFLLVIVIILAAVLAASCFLTERYVLQNGHLYPRNQERLDLRGRTLAEEDFSALTLQMPGTEILWDVPLSGGIAESTAAEISVSRLTAADVELLGYLPYLKTIHAEQCRDYDILRAICLQYPDVQVLYQVTVAGEEYPSDTKAMTIHSLTAEDVQNMQYLTQLSQVDGTACRDYAVMVQAQREHPQWHFITLDSVAGVKLNPDAASFEATGARYEELSVGLAVMPNLKQVQLHDPQASGEELVRLRAEYPNVEIHWDVTFGGVAYSEDAEEVDISHAPIGSVDAAKEIGSKFPNITKLIVDSTGISNEEMGNFREEMRSRYKVVWTIIFTPKCKARTDDNYFMPTKQGEYYFLDQYKDDLKYLEDVVALDLGHHPIRSTEFLRYMPKLKYLVLTDTQTYYITDIEYCKELIFLEVDWTYVRDLGNIQECTKLQDLSLNDGLVDPEVIKQLTWLEHLSWSHAQYGTLAAIDAALPNTTVISESYNAGAFYWRNLQNYYDSRDVLGMHYMK